MNWGDELCGVRVTPESWSGGIVLWNESAQHLNKGKWHILTPDARTLTTCYLGMNWHSADLAKWQTPVFPPRGFAGKTDAELWGAVFGEGCALHDCVWAEYSLGNMWAWLGLDVGCGRDTADSCAFNLLGPSQYAEIILALHNAQVLAARLGGGK